MAAVGRPRWRGAELLGSVRRRDAEMRNGTHAWGSGCPAWSRELEAIRACPRGMATYFHVPSFISISAWRRGEKARIHLRAALIGRCSVTPGVNHPRFGTTKHAVGTTERGEPGCIRGCGSAPAGPPTRGFGDVQIHSAICWQRAPPSLPPSPHESPECPQEVLKAAQNIPRAPSCQWVPKRFPPLLLKPSPFSPPRSSQWKPTPTPSAFRGSSVLPRPQFHPTEPGAAASNWKLGKFNTDTGRFLLYTAKINPWRSPGGGRWGVGGSREKAVSLPGFNKHSKDIYRAKGQIQSTSKDRCPPTSGLGYNLFLFL